MFRLGNFELWAWVKRLRRKCIWKSDYTTVYMTFKAFSTFNEKLLNYEFL